MIINIGPPLVALFVAAPFSLLELLTSEYPATYSLLLRSSYKLYIYGMIYGAIAFGTTLLIGNLSEAGIVSLEGPGLSNPWIRAILLGITVKAILHVRLFSVGSKGGQQFPVGIETVMQLFEPWLLREIAIDHFNAVRGYIKLSSEEYKNLKEVRKLIKNSIPAKFPSAEKTAFAADIDNASNVIQAMELFIGFLGVQSFDIVFPTKPNVPTR